MVISFTDLSAQDTIKIKYNDMIRLKSGLVVKCKIIDYDAKGTYIEKKNRDTVYLLHDDFKIILQNGASELIKETDKKMYEKKWLTSIDAGVALGHEKDYIISGTVVDISMSRRLDKRFNHTVRCGLGFLSTHFSSGEFESVYTNVLSLNLGYQYNLRQGSKVPFVFADFGKPLYRKIVDRGNFSDPAFLSINSGLGLEFKHNAYSYRISASYFYWNFNNAVFSSNGISLEDTPLTKVLLKFGISM